MGLLGADMLCLTPLYPFYPPVYLGITISMGHVAPQAGPRHVGGGSPSLVVSPNIYAIIQALDPGLPT